MSECGCEKATPVANRERSVTFHQRGHHVQHSHRRNVFADDGSHLNGAMIALMPTEEDAKRLAVRGGEKADDLHCTLFFLGDDAEAWAEDQRTDLIKLVRGYASELGGPVTANIFGIAHWNGGGDNPSWVWSVGDDHESDVDLQLSHTLAVMAVESMTDQPDIPHQHSPWVAHVCAAYTSDLTLAKELEKRLGQVTFDRIRLSFGHDDTDIPLGRSVTASGLLRRDPEDFEAHVNFQAFQADWEDAVGHTLSGLDKVMTKWRSSIASQVKASLEDDRPEALTSLSVPTAEARVMVEQQMVALAEQAGRQVQKEAEDQGIEVPDWSIGSVTAALSGRRLLSSVAQMTADALAGTLITSAKRRVTQLLGLSRTPEQAAQDVEQAMVETTDAGQKAALGTAMTTAQNTGRKTVLEVTPPATYRASEILDSNTCSPCRRVDGEQFGDLERAIKAYPVSGYKDCVGSRYGNNCRGMIVANWTEARTASAATEADTVPWHVTKSSECGSGKPWAVVKDSSGEIEGCHATKTEANDQMAALYAAEGGEAVSTATETLGGKPNKGTKKDKRLEENNYSGEKADQGITLTEDGRIINADGNDVTALEGECPPNMEMDPGTGECVPMDGRGDMATMTAPWEGVLVVEGEATGDGREFAPDALSWSEEITPGEVLLRWNKEDSHGGEVRTKAVAVGRIDKIWKDGNKIMGKGVFDLGHEDGKEAFRRVRDKFLRGVSIDADDVKGADIEFVWPEPDDDGEDSLMDLFFAQPEKMIYHGGRIRAATLCDIPAFVEAWIKVSDESGAVVASGAPMPEQVLARRVEQVTERRKAARDEALTAHGGPEWRPPAEWFENPSLAVETTVHVTDEGRVYGHAARWGVCHIGHMDACVQAPKEDDFPYFLTGELVTAEGKRVSVGQVTVSTNHADLYAGAGPAKEHYENTGNAVADVAVGADQIGIWVAGAIRPNADPLMIHELRASGEVSGDWRRIGGQYRLVGLLGVNVGGFVVPNMRARVAGGEVQALIAAGRLSARRPHPGHGEMGKEQAYKIVMDDLYAQMITDTEGSE